MTPQDFLRLCQALAPASGFWSGQFRELEFVSGAKEPGYVDRHQVRDRRLSSGADCLRTRLPRRYYPLLWELRSRL